MFLKSIRFKLTLWYVVTLAAILLLFSTFIYLTTSNRLNAEVDRELLAIAEAVASPTFEPFRKSAPTVMDQILEDFIGTKVAGKFVQINDANGLPLARSRNLLSSPLPLDKRGRFLAGLGKSTFRTHRGIDPYPVRVVALPVMERGKLVQVVQVGKLLDVTTDILDKLLLVFAISIPMSLALLWYGGWFLAGRALKPVEIITANAREISADNLSQRLAVVNPNDEIGALAKTFNATLDRLENAFKRTRQFSRDVSHELRTPLTILRGETELGLRWRGNPDEFKKILKSNMEEINRMSDIIGDLLELSRAEEGKLPLEWADLHLDRLLEDLCHQNNAKAEEKNITLSLAPHPPVLVSGDLPRLKTLFRHLLDNAIKFTPPDGKVSIFVEEDKGWVKVSVVDTGPGIPEKDVPHVFEQFYRVDNARNRNDGGSGLGLSLVRSLSEAHGGRVELQSLSGSGSTFTVFLPISAADLS